MLTINGSPLVSSWRWPTPSGPNWNDHLDDAERNRNAAASLGLVCEPAQNNGSTMRCLGSCRIVMAFDPATDGPGLLRTVTQLSRNSALTASNREDRDGIHMADEEIAEALGMPGNGTTMNGCAPTGCRGQPGSFVPKNSSDSVRMYAWSIRGNLRCRATCSSALSRRLRASERSSATSMPSRVM